MIHSWVAIVAHQGSTAPPFVSRDKDKPCNLIRPTTMSQAHLVKALDQIKNKDKVQIPDIDFTQHQLDDGSVVSTQERAVKDVSRLGFPRLLLTDVQVQAPAMTTPTDAQFFSRADPTKPDIAFLKNHFYREGRLTEDQALWIIERGTALLRAEPNLLEVDAPITGTCFAFSTRLCSSYL